MKTKQPHYLTKDGVEKLRAELKHLEGPVRLELAKRLRAAIQMGDLSENADYTTAKEEQGFIEGRIQELTLILRDVEIIEQEGSRNDVVEIGSRVTISEAGEPEETYLLVGPLEADPRNGRISFSSPIGEALIGHHVGETVVANTPAGELRLEIIRIK